MQELNKIYLSEFILNYLKENNMTLTQFAKESGIGIQSLSKCIHKKIFLSNKNLVKLSRYTNTDLSVLLRSNTNLINDVDQAIVKTNDLVLKLIKVLEGDQNDEKNS